MRASPRRAAAVAALSFLLALPVRARADEASAPTLRDEIDRLKERVRELEAALKKVQPDAAKNTATAPATPAATPAPDSTPATTVDAAELKERVDAMSDEVDRLGYAQRKGSSILDSLEGVRLNGQLTTYLQGTGTSADGYGDGKGTNASFSGDLGVTVPLGTFGGGYARILVGEGRGVTNALPPTFSSTNADLERHSDGISIAELLYETQLPFPDVVDKRVSVTLGKMDPRRYFDTNGMANNQRQQFLAGTFVNNISVEWGGDDNGYGLGGRLGYRFTSINSQNLTVQANAGIFQVGAPDEGFGGPFVIGELDVMRRTWGLTTNYRAFLWTNNAGHQNYDQLATGGTKKNWGAGVSLDQQVSSDLTLFGRWGFQDPSVSRFDHVVTLGARLVGNFWGRGGDVLGVAAGYARASDSYARVSRALDGVSVSGGETFIEAYYAYFFERKLHISPDVQYIRHPGAVIGADDRFVFALRTQFEF